MENTLIRLQHFSSLLGQNVSLDESLRQCAAMTARILNVRNSVIMLLGDGDGDGEGDAMLRVFAVGGELAAVAGAEPVGLDDAVLGPVISSGEARLVDGVDAADFLRLCHRVPDPFGSLVAAPIRVNDRVAGVISASGHIQDRPLARCDLEQIGIVGLLVGKSMQVIQLQSVLASRFAQLALVREAKANLGEALEKAVENPDRLAKILAKSFFREMTNAGFNSSQIINASSEIIAQLSSSLNRHSKRLGL